MKALVLEAINAELKLKEVTQKKAQEDDIIVNVHAAALNHRDVWITKGMYPGLKFPCVLGSDAAGTYEDRAVIIDPSFDWGDNPAVQNDQYNILGLPRDGSFAETVAVPLSHLADKPEHLSFSQAAALPLAGLTAYRALFSRAKLQSGEKVFISGIGGGVALFAFQFALAAGAEVYVSSSSEEKIQKAIAMGAKGGFNYKNEGWAKEASKQNGGFDVIIDSAGGAGFKNLVYIANPGGRISIYGGTRGKISDISPQIIFWKQLSILGSTMGHAGEFKEMVAFVNQHKIIPIIDSVYPIEKANEAFDKMDKGLQFGKIVLQIRE